MRRQIVVLVTIAAVMVIGGVAAAEQLTTGIKDDVHAQVDGGFSPKTLAKKQLTPVSPWITATLKTLSGAHVPPMREFILEGDRNASVSVKDVPVCERGMHSQRFTPADLLRMCRESLVGRGRMEAEIQFPDQPRIPVKSKLLFFNGRPEGRVATLYLHAYITVPTPASIVTTVKIKRIRKGRFGLQAVATIPKIAGGSGSVTFFKLRLKKGILSAKCPDGHLDARATAVFASIPPQELSAELTRPCTSR